MFRQLLAAIVVLTACVAGFADDAPHPDDVRDERLIELGRRLFFEPAASVRGDIACAACHDPMHAYSDPRRLSVEAGEKTRRHSQTLLDLGTGVMHWDGEFETLRHLIARRTASRRDRDELTSARLSANFRGPSVPFFATSSLEFYGGRPVMFDGAGADVWLRRDGRHGRGFELAFGDPKITIERVVNALQAYVGALRSSESPFDRHVAGRTDALPPTAMRGLALFRGRAKCATCHPLDAGRAISDGGFHDTGAASRRGRWRDRGREVVTDSEQDRWKFKTPNLRDVATRRVFMHDAAFTSLAQVIDHYASGGHSQDELEPIDLSVRDRADLVAFLHALTGDAGHVAPVTPISTRRTTDVRIVDLEGAPFAGLFVAALPAGDPLRRGALAVRPLDSMTDADGRAKLTLPATSHFTLSSKGYEIDATRLQPDWTDDATFIATPLDRVSVVADWSELRERPERLRVSAVVEGESRVLHLSHVRALGRRESVYAWADRLEGRYQIDEIQALGERSKVDLRDFDLDLSGGASAPIRLRQPELRTGGAADEHCGGSES